MNSKDNTSSSELPSTPAAVAVPHIVHEISRDPDTLELIHRLTVDGQPGQWILSYTVARCGKYNATMSLNGMCTEQVWEVTVIRTPVAAFVTTVDMG